MDLSYLQKQFLGNKIGEWAVFLGYSGFFLAYVYYCKKHPDIFDKLNKKLGLEKKIDKD